MESRGARLCPAVGPIREKLLVLDVENNADGSCAGIGFTFDGKDIHFYCAEKAMAWNKRIFEGCELVGHNIKYDVQMLRKWGFNVSPEQIVYDTALASYVQDSTRMSHGLKQLAKSILGVERPSFKDLCGTGKKAINVGELPLSVLSNYNGCDVLDTYQLKVKQEAELTEKQRAYLNHIELPTQRVLLEMEERGVQIDTDRLHRLALEFSGEHLDLRKKICESLKITNPNSNKQMGDALTALHYKLPKTPKGAVSVGADALKPYHNDPIIAPIVRFNELETLLSYFLEPIAEKVKDGRLYGTFNQVVTDTGRLSSSGPNLQNIPTRTEDGNRVRECFIAKPGYVLVDADYSQIEPRLMAHLSQDPALLKVFRDNVDLYDFVSDSVGLPVDEKSRKISKVLWLAMSYNAGAFKLSKSAGISLYDAQKFLNRMKARFEKFFYWKDKVMANAEIGGGIATLFGRRIPLDADYAHLGPNYTVQGSAAEIMKMAIIATRGLSPILTVHDELIFELSRAEDLETATDTIQTLMEQVCELSVPIKVEVGAGASWAEAKS